MKKKRSLQKDLLFLSTSSFLVTAAWVGFNVFHSWVTTTITPELQVQITAIDPEFDTATISNLKTRKKVLPVTTLSGRPIPEPSAGVSDILPDEQTTPEISPSPAPVLQTQPVAPTVLPNVTVAPTGP